MLLAPVVGLILGIVAAAIVFAVRQAAGPEFLEGAASTIVRRATLVDLLAATIAIASLAWITRGLHLDGLADTADGLGIQGDRDARLAAMKDPHVGTFGTVVLVCCLAVQIVALAGSIRVGHGTLAVIVAVTTGRLSLTWSCVRGVPAATPDGLGAMVAGTVPRLAAMGMTIAVLGLAISYGLLDDDATRRLALVAGSSVLVGLATTWWLRRVAIRQVGGITGDILGAGVELATATVLLVLIVA
jgi:adenosylcobinamide-GDP ribazoletransferase